MGEFDEVEKYLLRWKYPEKANLRKKYRNNFKIEAGILYYRKYATRGEELWKICARSEDEKKRILESCYAGSTGM